MVNQVSVVDNLHNIESSVQAVFDFYYLPQHKIDIIAVSKNHNPDHIRPLLLAGHRIFGENKVTEALEKWTPLKAEFPDIELHLIGALQTNKVKKALQIFDVIQTIDRVSLIDAVVKCPEYAHKKFFLQVNTGAESQKSGCLVSHVAELMDYAKENNLAISGLMAIPPVDDNPSYHFALLQSLCRQYGGLKMSAGMTNDYTKAIICATDYIRIGTAIFGERKQNLEHLENLSG